ncbi:MAG: FKBP-type peptidyl-prolyl cis-trans isomerase [Actinobacteria bacterium]|nr:FKBP-type peptidyl-prolyl cis-trans isomerase [Actinomycetota bacterium]
MLIKKGSTVTFAYKLFHDETLMDETLDGKPMTYTQGEGSLIVGLEKEMDGLKRGDKRSITVTPEDAYGMHTEERIIRVPRKEIPKEADVHVGDKVPGKDPEGEMLVGTIVEINDEFVSIDFNHELAGKELRFEVEVIEVAN